MFSTPKIGVVIPLANEEKTIDELIERVLRQLPHHSKLFCILDNISKDRTREKIIEWEKKDPRVTLVWAPENRCVVDAYFRGYQEAIKDQCDWILEMDGGLSHTPEEIPRFLEAMANGFDFAGGSRFMKGGVYVQRRIRYLISLLGTWLTNIALGTKMKDMTSGFECFTRKALESVLQKGVKSRAHFFQTEIRTLMHGWKWTEVPITYKNPSSKVGSSNIKEALGNLWILRKERTVENPLPFLLFLGSCIFMFFFFLFAPMRERILNLVPDDAFYYFGIAQRWNELGFSTFDGINPTNGYHPLWEWMLLLASRFFLEIEAFVRAGAALGVAFILGAAALLHRTFKTLNKNGASFVWYWMLSSFLFTAIYGMESPLSIFVLSALIYFLPKERKDVTIKRALFLGLLSGLLFLARIDTLIWVVALDFLVILGFRPWKALLSFFFVQAATIVGFFLYNLTFWGHTFTISAMLKAARTDFFSFNIDLNIFYLEFIVISFLSLVVIAYWLSDFFKKKQDSLTSRTALVLWLALSNLLYLAAILAKGGDETYNWYFVHVVLSGAFLLPYLVEHEDIFKFSIKTKWRLAFIFSTIILVGNIHSQLTRMSSFVDSYNRALELTQYPVDSLIFPCHDCGILGSISKQHAINLDGLTNSFEYQQSLKDDYFTEWLKKTEINSYFTSWQMEEIDHVILEPLPGIDGVTRKALLRLSPWPDSTANESKILRLYQVGKIEDYR